MLMRLKKLVGKVRLDWLLAAAVMVWVSALAIQRMDFAPVIQRAEREAENARGLAGTQATARAYCATHKTDPHCPQHAE